MARLFPPSPHPHLFLNVSNRACSECVVDCEDAACTVRIDDRCTDQCVIVPCDDPEHGDVPCPEGKCEPNCDTSDNCPLPGHVLATCDTPQHKSTCSCESKCDDPDNCLLANAIEHYPPLRSQFAAEQPYSPRIHSGDWDAAFDDFLCSCGTGFPSQDGTAPYDFPRYHYAGPSPALSTLASPSEINSLPCTLNPALPHPPCTPPLYATQPPAPIVPPGHTCLWNGCHSSFSSLEDLISHVNISHLRACSPRLPEPFAPSSYLRLSSDTLGLSCQWDNCHEYSSAPVNSSNCLGFNDALNLLTGHLLHDHLGLQGESGDHSVTTNHAVLPDVVLPLPAPDPGQDVEMRSEEQSSENKQRVMPSAGSAKQGDMIRWRNEQQPLPTAEDRELTRVIGGPKKCCWRGCELSFTSVDHLMNHVTVDHVGSGKNHYECFWSGCERHGEKGFASKQKVCRHLQMHTGHKPFQCKLCEQHFSEAATLQQHMRRHTQEKPYPCDFPGCGKAFAIAGALTIHRRTHMGEKPFKCKYCDRAFSESSNLSKHLRTHTGIRPYVCEEPGCGKTFSRPDQFTRHQRVHSKRGQAASPGNSGEMSQVFQLHSSDTQ